MSIYRLFLCGFDLGLVAINCSPQRLGLYCTDDYTGSLTLFLSSRVHALSEIRCYLNGHVVLTTFILCLSLDGYCW